MLLKLLKPKLYMLNQKRPALPVLLLMLLLQAGTLKAQMDNDEIMM